MQVTSDGGMKVEVSTSTSVASIFNSSAPPDNNRDMGTHNEASGGPVRPTQVILQEPLPIRRGLG